MTQQSRQNFVRSPHDVIVQSITISSINGDSYDITKLVEQFNIFQDLFSNFLTGNAIVVDGIGLAQSLPIIGDQTLRISFRSAISQDLLSLAFRVYRTTNKAVETNDNYSMYTLNFCSPEAFTNRHMKLSKTYKGKSSKIVTDIFEQLGSPKPLAVIDSVTQDRLIAPFWNPARAINWISRRARPSSNNDDSTYVFFQTLDGFVFDTLGNMSTKDPVFTYDRTPTNRVPVQGGSETKGRDIISTFRTIQQVTFPQAQNRMKLVQDGVFANAFQYYDIATKRFQIVTNTYSQTARQKPSLNDFQIVAQSNKTSDLFPFSHMQYGVISTDEYGQEDTTFVIDSDARRQAQMSVYESYQTNIVVPGNSQRRVGQVIQINIPSMRPTHEASKKSDVVLAGNYMIRSIRHRITRNKQYRMYMSLMKDSMLEPIADRKDPGRDTTTGNSDTTSKIQ